MSNDPLDTSDLGVPTDPREVAQALREVADSEGDYLGRLLMVAACHIEAFSKCDASQSPELLKEAMAVATSKI